MVNMESRLDLVSERRQHSLWVRISHVTNKFVMDSNNNDTEVPEDQPEEQALQLNVEDFACRSKAKAKPQRREPADYSPKIIPMNTRNWIDLNQVNILSLRTKFKKYFIFFVILNKCNEKMTERFMKIFKITTTVYSLV